MRSLFCDVCNMEKPIVKKLAITKTIQKSGVINLCSSCCRLYNIARNEYRVETSDKIFQWAEKNMKHIQDEIIILNTVEKYNELEENKNVE